MTGNTSCSEIAEILFFSKNKKICQQRVHSVDFAHHQPQILYLYVTAFQALFENLH